MSGTTSSSTVTPAPTQEAIGSPAVIPDGAVVNPTSPGVIGTPEAADDTTPSYTIDESTVIEKEDGTTTTLGDTLVDVDALKAKTVDLATDGSTYSGDVSGAKITISSGGASQTVTVSDYVSGMNTDMSALAQKTSKLSIDGTAYTGDVASASSGWTPDSATSAAPVSNAFQIVASMLAAKETEIEAVQAGVAGINSDITGINSAVSGLTTKTVDLSADGSKYSGDITTAHATAATGAKVAGSIMAETIAVVIPAIATKSTNLSTDGTTFAGAVTGDVTKAAVTPTGSEATTLGDAIADLGNTTGGLVTDIRALETKTSALSTDGKTFTGAVSGDVTAATITLSGETQTLPNTLVELCNIFDSDIHRLAVKTANLSEDSSEFFGSVPSATVTDPTTGKSGTLDAALGNMFTNPNAIVVDTGDDSVLVATADDFKRHSMFYIPVIQTSSSFKLPAIKDSTVAGYITVACAVSVPVTAADGSAVTTLTNGTYIIGADGSQSALVISQISDSAPDLKHPAA